MNFNLTNWIQHPNYKNIKIYSNRFFAFYINEKSKTFSTEKIDKNDQKIEGYSTFVEMDYANTLKTLLDNNYTVL